jgi:micrococcal nuclease
VSGLRARLAAVCIATALVAVAGAGAAAPTGPVAIGSACVNPPAPASPALAAVSQVIDGDTIGIRRPGGPPERLRLIGIDSPEVYNGDRLDDAARRSGQTVQEIRAQGRLAASFARRRLARQQVGLEFDVQRSDRFGRTLAYVWMPDGTLFNMLIVREGYAWVLTIPPNVRYAALFLVCEREAREARRGLWGR